MIFAFNLDFLVYTFSIERLRITAEANTASTTDTGITAYGTPTIYCTYEFAVKMLPAEGWVSDTMRDMVWSQGYLGSYKG